MASLFGKWFNFLPTFGALAGGGAAAALVAGTWYWATPDFWEVGYMPTQPGAGFNHQIHAGRLGMDCRYCHTHVEESMHSNVPTVNTCMNCHTENYLSGWESHDVGFVRAAYAADESIPWRKIHKLPEYAQFPHHVHVNAGVSCYSCHGNIAGMPVVFQAESLGMGWCLDCHRNPEEQIVPPEKVTDLYWVENDWFKQPVAQREHEGLTPAQLVEALRDAPPQHCAACHY